MSEAQSPKKFRFGVTGRGGTLAEWCEFARKAEALGYSTLVLPDHFSPQMAPLEALLVAAQVTTRLRIGTLVLDNDFRHPAMLAKEAATVDVLSDGRFELGVGTGSMPVDNEHTGIPLDSPRVRYERFAETVAILKQCFAADQKTVTFEGSYYQLHDLPALPKPVQRPHVPLMMGARGLRMLRLAAREADIIGVMGDGVEEKLTIIREAAGDRFDAIEFNSLHLRVQVDGHPQLGPPGGAALPPLIGSREQIIEPLLETRETQLVSYPVVIGTAIDAFAPIVARLAGSS